MNKLILIISTIVLFTSCTQSVNKQTPIQNVSKTNNFEYEEIKDDIAEETDNVNINNGVVDFQKDEIKVNFNLNKVEIIPDFNLSIGPVIKTMLSPNEKFLYIATGQGGGTASFIYDIKNNKTYFCQGAKDVGEWLDDGRLEVVNYEHYDNAGKIINKLQSIDSSKPWELESFSINIPLDWTVDEDGFYQSSNPKNQTSFRHLTFDIDPIGYTSNGRETYQSAQGITWEIFYAKLDEEYLDIGSDTKVFSQINGPVQFIYSYDEKINVDAIDQLKGVLDSYREL